MTNEKFKEAVKTIILSAAIRIQERALDAGDLTLGEFKKWLKEKENEAQS